MIVRVAESDVGRPEIKYNSNCEDDTLRHVKGQICCLCHKQPQFDFCIYIFV